MSTLEQMLPAKDKENLCKEEGCAAADDAGRAGRRRAARPGAGGAAEAGEHLGRPGAQQGEARAPHPGRSPESRAGQLPVTGHISCWEKMLVSTPDAPTLC